MWRRKLTALGFGIVLALSVASYSVQAEPYGKPDTNWQTLDDLLLSIETEAKASSEELKTLQDYLKMVSASLQESQTETRELSRLSVQLVSAYQNSEKARITAENRNRWLIGGLVVSVTAFLFALVF